METGHQNLPPDHEAAAHARPRYVPPAILWEEDYRPTAFGISCAQLPGNPACNVFSTA
jgi:hypothetical protein